MITAINPVSPDKTYAYTTLPPPPGLSLMSAYAARSFDSARAACEALTQAYGHHADAGEADALAALFTADGEFRRLGVSIAGRERIRDFIASRPRDIWQRHCSSGFVFRLADDGRSAHGSLDLMLERGQLGDTRITETRYARYQDRFLLTDQGWKFSLREVQWLEPSA